MALQSLYRKLNMRYLSPLLLTGLTKLYLESYGVVDCINTGTSPTVPDANTNPIHYGSIQPERQQIVDCNQCSSWLEHLLLWRRLFSPSSSSLVTSLTMCASIV